MKRDIQETLHQTSEQDSQLAISHGYKSEMLLYCWLWNNGSKSHSIDHSYLLSKFAFMSTFDLEPAHSV